MSSLIIPIAIVLDINPYGVEQPRGSSRLDLESYVAIKMITHKGDV